MQAPEHTFFNGENTETWDELSELETIADLDIAQEKSPPSAEDFRVWFEHYPETNVRRLLSEIEVVLIEAALTDQEGHIAKAAEKLMLRRTTLIEKMKKYGINQN
jgi:sigma-54 specific flagellar transcriptional regulator A